MTENYLYYGNLKCAGEEVFFVDKIPQGGELLVSVI